MDRDLDQAAYNDLLQLAKRLAVSVETGDESLTWDTAYAIKDWTEERGLVSFWAVFRERNGHSAYLDGWRLRDDEDVMIYVERDREEWSLRVGDVLLFYKNYRDRSPGQPVFTMPVEPEAESPLAAVDVNWKNEGF